MEANFTLEEMRRIASSRRTVTFTRCVGLEVGGRSIKVRGTLKLTYEGAFDEGAAVLSMWMEGETPKIDLRPSPDGAFVVSHGMEVASFQEALTETQFHFDDPMVREAMEAVQEAAIQELTRVSPFEQAMAEISIGGVTPKQQLMNSGSPVVGLLE